MSRILNSSETIITQPFKGIGIHNGIDVVGAGHTTCEVLAHTSGVVEIAVTGQRNNPYATGDASYGNFVKIKHANGSATLYAHLESVYVKVGEHVATGQVLGFMGNTGRSFGAHLHFEYRRKGTYSSLANPEPYINADLPGLSSNTGYIVNELVGEWQRAMNNSYNLDLAVDNSYGPASQRAANKHQLYWKEKQMHNEAVRFVQDKLKRLGFNGVDGLPIDVDGYFGADTNHAVAEYQKARNIQSDGYVGATTIEWLLKDKY